jgi:hypothetical protein
MAHLESQPRRGKGKREERAGREKEKKFLTCFSRLVHLPRMANLESLPRVPRGIRGPGAGTEFRKFGAFKTVPTFGNSKLCFSVWYGEGREGKVEGEGREKGTEEEGRR